MTEHVERTKKSNLAINIGFGANIFLAAVKTTVGLVGHSPALLAEGVNSTSDVAYYIVAMVFVRLANKPADEDHPYGHQQLENIASLVVGSFIVTTAVAIFWDAVDKIYALLTNAVASHGATQLALWIALLTIATKIFLFYFTRKIGKDTNNPVVDAMAFDHGNDLISAAAASIGIFLGQRGYPWVDPLAGAIVSILILRTGIHILRESAYDLMNAVPSKQLANKVRNILDGVEGVQQLHEVHAHRFGPNLIINITIGIDGKLQVWDGNDIATLAESALYNGIPNLRRVHVHYHPSREELAQLSLEDILARSRKSTSY